MRVFDVYRLMPCGLRAVNEKESFRILKQFTDSFDIVFRPRDVGNGVHADETHVIV